jgi:release factor glutamine methyltransferase
LTSGWTTKAALEWASDLFNSNESMSAGLDSELLLCHTMGLRRVDLYIDTERPLSPEERDTYMAYIFRRVKGEPVAYITREKEFYGLSFEVGPGVLIPRPETELLVEKTLELAPHGSTVIEIGTGSGAVIISVLVCRHDLKGFATDISRDALLIARKNAFRHNVGKRITFAVADAIEAIGADSQMIVMNPPYVSEKDIRLLPKDILKFEPRCALFGGVDGMSVIQKVIKRLDSCLKPGGILIMETGYDQQEKTAATCSDNENLTIRQWFNDLAGRPRVIIIERKAA